MLDWRNDVRPVLVAVYEALAAEGGMIPTTDLGGVSAALGRETEDERTYRVLVELKEKGYISGTQTGGGGFVLIQLQEKGLQEVAGWPTRPGEDTYAQLLAALSERIEQSDSPEERTKLERFRDALAGVGRDVLTDVLAKVATSGL
jgi:DNA-binding PadR family transcriptional regulator